MRRTSARRWGATMDEHVELELELAADGQDGYRVTVRSAAGEESGRLLLDPVAPAATASRCCSRPSSRRR